MRLKFLSPTGFLLKKMVQKISELPGNLRVAGEVASWRLWFIANPDLVDQAE
jgi:hypothetical protein